MNRFIGGIAGFAITTDAWSGKRRRIARIQLPHGASTVLVAFRGVGNTNPLWYHNVVAHPPLQIRVDGKEKQDRTRQVSDAEEGAGKMLL